MAMSAAPSPILQQPGTTIRRIMHCMRWCTPLDMLCFYTTVNVLLVALWPLSVRVVDPFLSAFVVAIVSSYIVNVRPRALGYAFPGWCPASKEPELACSGALRGLDLHVLHVLVHITPLVIAALIVQRSGDTLSYGRAAATLLLLLVYISLVCPRHVYGVSHEELAVLVLAAAAAYFWLRRK